MTEPLHNSGIPPINPAKPPARDKPMVGSGEEAQPKPFSLPPEPGKAPPPGGEKVEGAPTPMELAREQERSASPQWTQEEMSGKLTDLEDKFGRTRTLFDNPALANKMTPDHDEALSRLTGKLDVDLKGIVSQVGKEHAQVNKKGDESVFNFVTRWLDGSQKTMSQALNGFANIHGMDPSSYFKLQASVQRASERAELFASILGSTVSGVKTLMSTQLG